MRPTRSLLFCGLLSFNVFAAGVSAQFKTNIGVSDLAGQGVEASTASVISDRLRSELFNTGSVTVLERSQMQEILKEQGLQQAGCTSDQCAVETGQMLGVKFMVVGSIGHVGHTYTVACRLIDVSTGKMVATATADCKCEIDDILSRSTVEIARKLAQSFSAAESNESPKPAPPAAGTGSLRIVSSPEGASLFVDDSEQGTTPASLDSLKPGRYRLRLQLQGYNPVTGTIDISAGSAVEKRYTLRTAPGAHPQVQNGKKHSPTWLKISLGAGTIVAAGAGIMFDQLEKSETAKCSEIASQYAGSGSNAAYAIYRQDYQGHYNSAKKDDLGRNVLYGASLVFAAGFAISFAF